MSSMLTNMDDVAIEMSAEVHRRRGSGAEVGRLQWFLEVPNATCLGLP